MCPPHWRIPTSSGFLRLPRCFAPLSPGQAVSPPGTPFPANFSSSHLTKMPPPMCVAGPDPSPGLLWPLDTPRCLSPSPNWSGLGPSGQHRAGANRTPGPAATACPQLPLCVWPHRRRPGPGRCSQLCHSGGSGPSCSLQLLLSGLRRPKRSPRALQPLTQAAKSLNPLGAERDLRYLGWSACRLGRGWGRGSASQGLLSLPLVLVWVLPDRDEPNTG